MNAASLHELLGSVAAREQTILGRDWFEVTT